MMNKYGSFFIPFVMLSALLISGFLFYSNVMARRYEIGILIATGKSKFYVSSIILLKAFFLGLTGSIAGFFIGSFIAKYFGMEIFRFTAMSIKPLWSLFGYSIVIFPVLWMLSSWIPALLATQVDVARTLSQE
jgi:putative ABC transport system permease protein